MTGSILYFPAQSISPDSTWRDALLITSMASGEAAVTTSTGTWNVCDQRSPCVACTSASGSRTVTRSDPGEAGVGPPWAWYPAPYWLYEVTRVVTESTWKAGSAGARMS